MNTNIHNPAPSKLPVWICILLTVFLAAVHLWHGLRRYADFDEFQTLCNAADAFRGLTLYAHFWDNHGPLNTWFFQPFFYFNQHSHSLIFLLRGIMWVLTLISGFLTWKLARLLYTHSQALPWVALVFLLSAPPFLYKSLEIRGDNLANVLALIGLFLACYGVIHNKRWPFFIAGICLGAIATITLKVLLITIAYGIIAISACYSSRRIPSIKQISLFAAGCVLPLIAVLPLIDIELFYLCVVKANTTRASAQISAAEIVEIAKKAPAWFALAGTSVIASIIRTIKHKSFTFETGCVLAVILLLIQFIFLLPTKNMQSLLPLYPPLAILAGINGARMLEIYHSRYTSRYPLIVISLILATLFYANISLYCKLSNKELPRQVRFADQVLDATKTEPFLFDPAGIVFQKPSPGQFHVLVTFLRDGYLAGKIDLQILPLLTKNSINSIIFSKRIATLPTQDINYINENYAPVLQGPDTLLLQAEPTMPHNSALETSEVYNKWKKKKQDEKESLPQHPADFEWFSRYRELTR